MGTIAMNREPRKWWETLIAWVVLIVVFAIVSVAGLKCASMMDEDNQKEIASHDTEWSVEACNNWGCDHYWSVDRPVYATATQCLSFTDHIICRSANVRFQITDPVKPKEQGDRQ